jgi:nucleoside-diphosphate-sugar epimerase
MGSSGIATDMKHLFCFGFGFSAQTLAAQLDRSDWKISGTSRSDHGVKAITEQNCQGILFGDLKTIPQDVTHILSSVPPGDDGDVVIQKFMAEMLDRRFQWIGYLSTTGVYGDHNGAWVDENTPLTPNTKRGEKRVKAETEWLKLTAHIFRLAGIYGPGSNQLESLKNGTAKRIIKEGQIFSRIHVEDIAGIVAASIAKPHPSSVYNGADDEPCPPQEVITFAAQILGLAPPPEIAFEDAELSPMAKSFYSDSKKVSNARVKNELGYQFKYPNYRVGLTQELNRISRSA